mmetsp:Transcript_10771/g.16200  ORF Transcript_10771/g.16200 Transcript_10771/m.16200 type:complete len:305 (-) Transcript_10771:1031-1945(-)
MSQCPQRTQHHLSTRRQLGQLFLKRLIHVKLAHILKLVALFHRLDLGGNLFKEAMRHTLLHRTALIRIENEHLADQVNLVLAHVLALCARRIVKNVVLERFARFIGQRQHPTQRIVRLDPRLAIGHIRRAHRVKNEFELLEMIVAGKDGFTQNHLAIDAGDTPHIHAVLVLARAQHNLGRAIPSRSHILAEQHIIVFLVFDTAGHAKVCDLDGAIAIDQNVLRLDVAMNHVTPVNIEHTIQNLIQDKTAMIARNVNVAVTAHRLQCRLHLWHHIVHLLIARNVLVLGQHTIDHVDDVGMVKMHQ